MYIIHVLIQLTKENFEEQTPLKEFHLRLVPQKKKKFPAFCVKKNSQAFIRISFGTVHKVRMESTRISGRYFTL